MDQWVSFGGAGGPSPWEFGWNALAAMGSLFAAGVALFIHFHQQKVVRDDAVRRHALRTEAVAPQLAADVMLLDWKIGTSMRQIMDVLKLPADEVVPSLEVAWAMGKLRLDSGVGESVPAGDLEWLCDDVRLKLASLRAQISVTNAMWRRLLTEDPTPFKTRQLAVDALLKDTVHQVVDTATSAILLLEALDAYLPEPLKELVNSVKKQHAFFTAIYEKVPRAAVGNRHVEAPPAERRG